MSPLTNKLYQKGFIMDKFEIAEELGKKIIKNQQDYFAEGNSEDVHHITNQKRIITSITEYLESDNLPAHQIKQTLVQLEQRAKELFISTCISKMDDDEDEESVKESSEIWFDYIYENEKYPR
jgi:hypothetical protein